MTHNEFDHILASIPALSPDQMRQLARELENKMVAMEKPPAQAAAAGQNAALTESESADQEIQRRLFNAGLLSEIKPPLRDLTSYRDRKAVPIKGEPLSATVIRERR
jgi:hypothetical protein